MANILLIEDDKSVSSYLKKGFGEEGIYVEVAKDYSKALVQATIRHYDLIIIDIDIPEKKELHICKQFRNTLGDSIKILLLSSISSPREIAKGLEFGANDHIEIPFKFKDILERVAVLLERNHFNPCLQFADIELNTEDKTVRRGDRNINLTMKEYKLLEYFLLHPNHVIARTTLLEEIWDKNSKHESNVVDVCINYLRNKIDKNFPVKLIHAVTGMGYILKEK